MGLLRNIVIKINSQMEAIKMKTKQTKEYIALKEKIENQFLKAIEEYGVSKVSKETGLPMTTLYSYCGEDAAMPSLSNAILIAKVISFDLSSL
jgi:hypothetical protein